VTYQSFMNALIGGALVGLAAAMMLLFNGRIAGISGISGGLLNYRKNEWAWRLAFVLGLVAGGGLLLLLLPGAVDPTTDRPLWTTGLAGLLVGFGTSLGSGCTSGHGVCGISRLSPRSIVATIVFMAAGFATVFVYGLKAG